MFVKQGGRTEDFRKNLLKRELVDTVKAFQASHSKAIDSIQNGVIEVASGTLMSNATQYDRQLHLARLRAAKKTRQNLIDTGNRMIRSF